jgi:hypothetical protein
MPPPRRRPRPPKPPLRTPKLPFLDKGRAWINGNEVGGSDPRFAHLNRSYD